MVTVIAGRELKSLFLSPLAWTILAVVQFILAWLFLAQLETFTLLAPQLAMMEGAPGVTDVVVAPVFGNAGVIMLLVAPLITMRVLAEERRARTLSLLISAPVSMTEIVLGKYLGVLAFFLIMLAITALMPLSLALGTELDYGKLAAGLLGLALLLAAFTAAGVFMSSLTEQPTVAAIGGFGLLLFVWIIDWAGGSSGKAGSVLSELSMLRHYEPLLKGLFDTSDLAYYLLFIVTFLVLAILRMDADRLPH